MPCCSPTPFRRASQAPHRPLSSRRTARSSLTVSSRSVRSRSGFEMALKDLACPAWIQDAVPTRFSRSASLLPDDAMRFNRTGSLRELRPAQLIGQVLQPRLGGSWDSRTPGRPIHDWRVSVAQRRNSLLHLGARATGADADSAVRAMNELAAHLLNRLAAKSDTYPQTAYALVGLAGLEQRGRDAAALSALVNATGGPDAWIDAYAAFVADLLDDTET